MEVPLLDSKVIDSKVTSTIFKSKDRKPWSDDPYRQDGEGWITRFDFSPDGGAIERRDYTHDGVGRVTDTTGTDAVNFIYDANGNRTDGSRVTGADKWLADDG